MVNFHQNIPLNHDMVFLFSFLDIFFPQDLHGVDTTVIIFALDQDNLSIGSFANGGEQVEVIKGHLLVHFVYINIYADGECKITENEVKRERKILKPGPTFAYLKMWPNEAVWIKYR